jgi:hypothetical protein
VPRHCAFKILLLTIALSCGKRSLALIAEKIIFTNGIKNFNTFVKTEQDGLKEIICH